MDHIIPEVEIWIIYSFSSKQTNKKPIYFFKKSEKIFVFPDWLWETTFKTILE